MKRFKIFILIIISAVLYSCSHYAEKKLNKILLITGDVFKESAYFSIGERSGEAVISIKGTIAEVSYSCRNDEENNHLVSYIKTGDLNNIRLSVDGSADTYLIIADWVNHEGDDGVFLLQNLGKEQANAVYIGIQGDNWKYYCEKKLSEEEYKKFCNILKIRKNNFTRLVSD